MTGYIPTLEQIDELHRKIAPSKAAYELVHTHCVIVATIGCQIVRRQNALFTRRCTLPKDAEVPPTAGVTGRPCAAASARRAFGTHRRTAA